MPDADFPITVDYDDTYWLGIEQGYVLLDVLGTPTWVDLSRVYQARTSPPTWYDVWDVLVSENEDVIISEHQVWKKIT